MFGQRLPSSIDPTKGLESNNLLVVRPCYAFRIFSRRSNHSYSSGPQAFGSEYRALHTFKKNLVVQRGFSSAAKRYPNVYEVRVLCEPLICLPRAHGPPEDGSKVLNAEAFDEEVTLRADIVVKADFGERFRRRGIGR